ncbi:MAG: hypothetical protein R2827_03810 [Bdellovibrionales bacterium]
MGCARNPRPQFILAEDQTTVILNVIADFNGPCTMLYEGQYDLVFDLRSQLELHEIDVHDKMILKVGDTGESFPIGPYKFDGAFPFFDDLIEGDLTSAGDGTFLLLTKSDDGEAVVFQIKITPPMTAETLNPYIGQRVGVSGYIFEYTVPDLIFNTDNSSSSLKPTTVWLSGVSMISP